MISCFVSNVCRTRHGTSLTVTRASFPISHMSRAMMTHSYCSVTHSRHQKECAWCSALCYGYTMPVCKQLRRSVVAQMFGWHLMEQGKQFVRKITVFCCAP